MLRLSSATSSTRFKPASLVYVAFIGAGLLFGAVPALINLYVDPYEILTEKGRTGKLGEIAEKAHYPLWKLAKYRKGQSNTIVLGDSRARALREKYWTSLGFNYVKNLAYGGGTIPEIHETFKQIKDDAAVQNLVVGIQLRSFDEDHKQGMNRVPEAVALIKNPVDYVFNWTVLKTSLSVAEAEHAATLNFVKGLSLAPAKAQAGEPRTQKNSNPFKNVHLVSNLYEPVVTERPLAKKFESQIKRNAKSDWRNFEFSEKYWSHIEEIGRWAEENGKTLIFVIPPTIVEMQATISSHGLSDLNIKLRRLLSKHGLVLDFDIPGELADNAENFTDAYHFNAVISRQIVGEIVGQLSTDNQTLARVEKRRGIIECGLLKKEGREIKFDKGTELLLGQNCNIWTGKKT